MVNNSSVNCLSKEVNLVVTQKFVSELVPHHRKIELFGASYLAKDEVVIPKIVKTGSLTVCFSSLGDGRVKGAYIYQEIIDHCRTKYPQLNIDFCWSGANYQLTNGRYLGLLSQAELDTFYYTTCDIVLNLDNGSQFNGFPLGVEGALQGCVLFTTDVHDLNRRNQFNFSSALRIIELNKISDIVDSIMELDNNRELLLRDSHQLQSEIVNKFSFDRMVAPIFQFIESPTSLRVLVTDFLFPNKLASWRLVEIKGFIERYDTDILVIGRPTTHYNVEFTFDWELLLESHHLDRYDLLIFDPQFNHLNKFNRGFDGTQFNNVISTAKAPVFSYLLRLTKYRAQPLNLSIYSAVYHIFFQNYAGYNSKILFPQERQFIHLYPGGGFYTANHGHQLGPKVHLITTQRYMTDFCSKGISCLELFGGPFLHEHERPIQKALKTGPLKVCFTSIGLASAKGADVYQIIVETYHKTYPDSSVQFVQAGRDYGIRGATYLGLVSQDSLNELYSNEVDILFNLDKGTELNGFPLGIEGALRGAILFTTDPHNSNQRNNFYFSRALRIVNPREIPKIVEQIHSLDLDRNLLMADSHQLQAEMVAKFSFERMMIPTFEFIEGVITTRAS